MEKQEPQFLLLDAPSLLVRELLYKLGLIRNDLFHSKEGKYFGVSPFQEKVN